MVVVKKKRGENTDTLLKRFTKITKEENIAFDVNKKKYYLKPSLLKKEKMKDKLKRKAMQKKRFSR
ncbi:30S ribosomal protein S21 [Candidatus Roizmanbacteria bacterium RIFCSPLOWO2_02_FULL_37_19]|uniref:Small ribosomal subunit protein bS21 n=1 Tax=Candidatus Roizmanbacteria bacterium RIFCSPHIGHO2_02_FULL_37_24 TaxID=1802037 RepID=A0A1F7GVP1_9BACT|nr:MAG: 30S ribosomal protein S21 [Candidatus Roizmanbacteria bacterium RIFCSPHIGHO2_01_FULL_38_41]OGK22953.1 MAG: 30S ribosomal protein S21 [Candidatus Roizmanbacteria bacterium RIFCSPHIGHO2_02_FULL_37_24]OGK33593.1 MAG: 30S ribosomal protein S21 [Candidatus Roizmanbacteria bacterium RIFCSPHIGHO2_12_FULL_37_23]OGK44202.1 MAG: 30S ribosomal protein S21 [Candidatus Roizmanbacteria bacterium RIFCSPLOWO2_01_FULL_37_57]OGK55245.1 MAG: 30S ribosomal protein S21 [Candidatus Roizmanbacteria bacterium 